MKTGMLWLDDDKKRSLEEKVQRAVDYYSEKYGRMPELCLVNQRTVAVALKVGSVEVRPVTNVHPSHFWLGVEAQGA